MAGPILDFESLLRIPYVEAEIGFEISPDGRQVAFSWNLSGQWEIYLLDYSGSEPARKLTSGEGAKFCPRFSPDGSHLLYTLDVNGSEKYDIFLINLQSGEETNLSPDTEETILPKVSWSPDSRNLAFISNRSGRFSTYIQSLDTERGLLIGERWLVLDEHGPHWDVSWSPDGERLAVITESRLQDYAAFIVELRKKESSYSPMTLPLLKDTELLNVNWAAWSPNGNYLAFSGERDGYYQIGIYDRLKGNIEWLTSGEGDKTEAEWSPDGLGVTYVFSKGPLTWLAVHALDQKEPELFQVEAGVHSKPHFTPDGKSVLFIFNSPRRPDDLWQLDIEKGSLLQLTYSLPLDFSPDDFIVPSHITYPSMDGNPVPALLYQPNQGTIPSDGKPAAVIVIHGGPNWLFQFIWYPLMAHMSSRGWVVLAPNYRGSTGYGRSWQLANRFEMGRGDTMDVAAGADYLVSNGFADPSRIAVTGRSHGGYLTMSCLTMYPDLWVAGSAVVPFLNWFTSHANSRQDLQHWDRENMGDPIEHADLWRERSPYFHLDKVKAPVQLIGGANDPRCPASEAIAARDALLASGKSTDFLLYPDEGHTFLKLENILDQELRRVRFLSRVLDNSDTGEDHAPTQLSD